MHMKIRLLFIVAMAFLSVMAFPQVHFENGGFEDWEEVGLGSEMMEPVNWSSIKTSDATDLNPFAPVVWAKSADAHSGDFSVYLKNVTVFSFVVTGTITNGRVHSDMDRTKAYVYTGLDDSKWYSLLTERPDSLAGWFKSNSASGDFGTIDVSLHVGEYRQPGGAADTANLIGKALFHLPSDTTKEWTRFSVAFEYFQEGKPEYQLTILTSGNGTAALDSSETWFDDLEFIYNDGTPVEQTENMNKLIVYSSNGIINIRMEEPASNEYRIIISDILGRQVYNRILESNASLQLNPGKSGGIYIVRLIHGNNIYTRKVFVN